MLGIVICIGMNNALNTLSPLAAGAKDLKLGLTYLRRGQVVLTICFIPVLGLMLCSEQILIMIGQDPVVSRYAHEYNLAFLPAVYLFGIRDTTRRFLASVNQNQVSTILTLLGLLLQVVSVYYFLEVLKLDLVGIGLACCVTNGFLAISLEVYARFFCQELRSAFVDDDDNDNFKSSETAPWDGLRPEKPSYAVFSREGLADYLSLGWPNVFAFCAEAWAYQIMSFIAASFGVDY